MDTSKEYIVMCEKAVEIQKSWGTGNRGKPSKGDLVCSKHGEVKTICIETSNYPQPKYIRLQHSIWLPRQDQLQDILEDDVHFLLCYITRHCEGEIPIQHNYTSLEQLWLSLVMKEKYDKIWNGEDWQPNKEEVTKIYLRRNSQMIIDRERLLRLRRNVLMNRKEEVR